MPDEPPFESPFDLRLRIIGVMLEPALTLGCIMRVPLADLTQLVRTTYVRIGKTRGLSVRAMARRFGVAPNTIQAISNVLRDHELPERFGVGITRQRAIVAALMEHGGEIPIRDLRRALEGCADEEVVDAVDRLEEEGIVEKRGRKVGLAGPHFNIARKDAEYRLDSLRALAETFCQVVFHRFFQGTEPSDAALGRAFRIRCSEEDFARLKEELYEHAFEVCQRYDERAAEGEDAVGATVMLMVTKPPEQIAYWGRRETP